LLRPRDACAAAVCFLHYRLAAPAAAPQPNVLVTFQAVTTPGSSRSHARAALLPLSCRSPAAPARRLRRVLAFRLAFRFCVSFLPFASVFSGGRSYAVRAVFTSLARRLSRRPRSLRKPAHFQLKRATLP